MEKYGIKETSEALDAFVVARTQIDILTEDGEFSGSDYAAFAGAMFGPLLTGLQGGGLIPKELGDLSEDEATQLREKYNAIFGNPHLAQAFHGFVLGSDGLRDYIKSRQDSPAADPVADEIA